VLHRGRVACSMPFGLVLLVAILAAELHRGWCCLQHAVCVIVNYSDACSGAASGLMLLGACRSRDCYLGRQIFSIDVTWSRAFGQMLLAAKPSRQRCLQRCLQQCCTGAALLAAIPFSTMLLGVMPSVDVNWNRPFGQCYLQPNLRTMLVATQGLRSLLLVTLPSVIVTCNPTFGHCYLEQSLRALLLGNRAVRNFLRGKIWGTALSSVHCS
jgi:hypothetical protein